MNQQEAPASRQSVETAVDHEQLERLSPHVATPFISYLAIGLFVGAACPINVLLSPFIIFSLVCTISLIVIKYEHIIPRRLSLHVFAVLAALLGNMMASHQEHVDKAPYLLDAEVKITRLYISRFGQSAHCRIQEPYFGHPRSAYVHVYFPPVPALNVGDHVRMKGLCEWTETYSNWQMNLSAFDNIKQRDTGVHADLWLAIQQMPRHQGLASALLLGVAPQAEKQIFRQAGIAHVLVVSGLHVGIVFMLCAVLLRFSGLPWVLAQCCLIGILMYYAYLTGFAIPTQRAVLMGLIIILSNFLSRDLHRYAALSLTLILLVLWDPLSARSLGFQLSAAAVAGILSLGLSLQQLRTHYVPLRAWPLDRPIWRFCLFIARGACDGFVVGLAATLAVTPLLAYHIGVVNPWSPIATVLVTPFVSAVICSGGIYLALFAVWNNGPWHGFAVLCDWSLQALSEITAMLASLPGSVYAVETPPWFILLAWVFIFAPIADLRVALWRAVYVALLLITWAMV